MPEVRWSRRAERTSFQLPPRARAELIRTIDNLALFPEMYELVHEGRYRGYRHVQLGSGWKLYYRVVGRNRDCILGEIRSSYGRPA